MKFSSFKKDQLLMESWRSFLKEADKPEESEKDRRKRRHRQTYPSPGDPGYEESFKDPGPEAHAYYDPEAKSHEEPMKTTLGDVTDLGKLEPQGEPTETKIGPEALKWILDELDHRGVQLPADFGDMKSEDVIAVIIEAYKEHLDAMAKREKDPAYAGSGMKAYYDDPDKWREDRSIGPDDPISYGAKPKFYKGE